MCKNSNKKILYIEDDSQVSKELISVFNSLQFFVSHYDNSEDAYIDFQTKSYDLLIVDIELPGENGLQFVKKVRLLNKYIPILILSAYDSKEYLKEAIDGQVTKYITKPIDSTNFLKILDCLLGNIDNKIKLAKEIWYYQDKHEINYNNKVSKLTASEHIVINCLYNNKGNLVTYDQLTNLLDNVSIGILRTHIKNIRKKSSSDIIETITSFGYKLK